VLAIRDGASYYSTERLLIMLRFFPDPSQRARLLNNCSDPKLGITPPMAGRS